MMCEKKECYTTMSHVPEILEMVMKYATEKTIASIGALDENHETLLMRFCKKGASAGGIIQLLKTQSPEYRWLKNKDGTSALDILIKKRNGSGTYVSAAFGVLTQSFKSNA
eukprot:TRINITY_DN36470_c0_g3_i1.p1 TRINITY_DN36470_c0_g3~~TRINITY_DN36470_c0_g3_i1.p1  ORF type:complete len:121 (+),score=33.89 TRINITY_DN36470_c0_g3_i1:33-365(+)